MPEDKPLADLDKLFSALGDEPGLAEAVASLDDVDLNKLISQLNDNPRNTTDVKLRLNVSIKEHHDRYVRAAAVIATKITTAPIGSPQLAELSKKQKAIRRVLDQIRGFGTH